MQRITDETQEDLEYYESVLKDFGCNVIRPVTDPSENIMNYIDYNGKVSGSQGVPRSPLQPRDAQLVIGDTLYFTGIAHKSIRKTLNEYSSNFEMWQDTSKYFDEQDLAFRNWSEDRWNQLAGTDWGHYNDYKNNCNFFDNIDIDIKNEILNFVSSINLIPAPSLTTVGRDLYVDCRDQRFFTFQEKSLKEKIPNIRVNLLRHGGHSDSCFHTVKPGAILSLYEIQTYDNTFPGWDVCYLPDQSWAKVDGFLKLKKQVGGKWWVPGEEENDEFTHFVETWLQDWVGYVEETVFDVNVLVLDEHHVCVNNMNPTVIEFLKKHKMEPVHVPWRHRYFWDGGLHCITLDLEREGSQEDYFPERGDVGVIDHGFD